METKKSVKEPNLNPNEILENACIDFFKSGLQLEVSVVDDVSFEPDSSLTNHVFIVRLSSHPHGFVSCYTGLYDVIYYNKNNKPVLLLNKVRLNEFALSVGFAVNLLQILQNL